MDSVLTLIANPKNGGLTDDVAQAARAALRVLGAETQRVDWLHTGIACDIPFRGAALRAAAEAAAGGLDGQAIDLFCLPIANRRKTLLIADMDSTIVTGETLDELAAHAGIKGRIAAITARAMNGELDFKEALRERVGMLRGLSTDFLEKTWDEVQLTPGADVLVKTMRENGAYCLLVSGGFDYFTARARAACGFHGDQSNRFIIEDGKLTGKVVEPILDKESKINALLRASAEREIPMELTLAVGDGANDLPMIKAAGMGVAYHAKPSVVAEARYHVNHGDLSALLYAQGYRVEDFVTG